MAHNNLNPTGVKPVGSGLVVEPSGSGLGQDFDTNKAPVTNLGAAAAHPIETIAGKSVDETADDLPLPTSHLDLDGSEFTVDTSNVGWLVELLNREPGENNWEPKREPKRESKRESKRE